MRIKTVLTTLFVTAMLVVGIDYTSYAATGSHAILGKINRANSSTTLQRTTNGPAISLRTKPGSAPLSVNRNTKVGNLNADLLDGYDASSFAPNEPVRTLRYTTTSSSTAHSFPITGLAAGRYLVSYAVESSVAGSSGTPRFLFCSINQSIGGDESRTHVQGVSSGDSQLVFVALSATAVVDTANGTNPRLDCSSDVPWSTLPANDSSVSHTDARPVEINVIRLHDNVATASNARTASQQGLTTQATVK